MSKKTKIIKASALSQEEFDSLIKRKPEEIISYVKLPVKEFKKDGDRALFFYSLLRAVKWIGVSNFAKMTKLSRVCIYDTLDGTNQNPSLDTLSRILAVFGVKITFDFMEDKSSTKNLFNQKYFYHSAQ